MNKTFEVTVDFLIGETVALITDPAKKRIIDAYLVTEKEIKYRVNFCEDFSIHYSFELIKWNKGE